MYATVLKINKFKLVWNSKQNHICHKIILLLKGRKPTFIKAYIMLKKAASSCFGFASEILLQCDLEQAKAC